MDLLPPHPELVIEYETAPFLKILNKDIHENLGKDTHMCLESLLFNDLQIDLNFLDHSRGIKIIVLTLIILDYKHYKNANQHIKHRL